MKTPIVFNGGNGISGMVYLDQPQKKTLRVGVPKNGVLPFYLKFSRLNKPELLNLMEVGEFDCFKTHLGKMLPENAVFEKVSQQIFFQMVVV